MHPSILSPVTLPCPTFVSPIITQVTAQPYLSILVKASMSCTFPKSVVNSPLLFLFNPEVAFSLLLLEQQHSGHFPSNYWTSFVQKTKSFCSHFDQDIRTQQSELFWSLLAVYTSSSLLMPWIQILHLFQDSPYISNLPSTKILRVTYLTPAGCLINRQNKYT